MSCEIALLHYHDVSLNVSGKLEPPVELNEDEGIITLRFLRLI